MAMRSRGAAVPGLTAYLLDGVGDEPLSAELAAWMDEVRPFRRFIEAHRDKVRKKLRHATDAEGRRDVRAELLVARLLLADRRMELTFEPYGLRGGPDFRVAMRGQPAFNLEVTRLRASVDDAHVGAQLLTKLHQLPPSAPNLVLVTVQGAAADAVDLASIVRELRARADAKDEAFFVGRGFGSSRGFYQRFLRLSGAVMFSESVSEASRAALWTNSSARIALPARAARTALDLLRG